MWLSRSAVFIILATDQAAPTHMSDETHMVTLPDGKQRGPFSAEVLKDLFDSGALPPSSTIELGQVATPLPEALARLHERPRRASAEARAAQGGTKAETPIAISRAAQKRTSDSD